MKKTKDEKDKQDKQIGTWVMDIILCSVAFGMARIGVEQTYYTIGIAYIATLYETSFLRKWSWLFGACGVLSLAHFDVGHIKYIFMMLLVVVLRELFKKIELAITLRNQCMLTAFSVIVINSISTCITGVNTYQVVAGVFEGVVGGALVYILASGVGVIRKRNQAPLTKKEAVGIIFIMGALLAGLLDIYLQVPLCKEIYLKDIASFMVLIGVLYLGNINLGVTISMVISTLLVMIGYMPSSYVGIYGTMALMGGLFAPLGRIGIVVGCGIGQALGFIVFNGTEMDYPLIGAYCVAAGASVLLPKHYFGIVYWFQEKKQEIDEKAYLLRIQQLITEQLKHVVGGFEKLAQSFERVQVHLVDYTPKMINTVIEETGEKLCADCSMRHFCWEQGLKETYEQSYEMLETIERKGFIAEGDIPVAFKEHCLYAQNFAYILACKMDILKQDMVWRNRFLENRVLVAEELSAVAETLKTLIKDVDNKLYFNKDKEALIQEALRSEGVRVEDVRVLESRGKVKCITVYTKYCKNKTKQDSVIVKGITHAIGQQVVIETCTCKERKYCYKLNQENVYHVSSGAAFCAKENISGDVHTCMELSDDHYLLALADGMGSGLLAYRESAAAMEMLEDFMEAGFRKELAVKMINAALILKSDNERFSTMDITLIDKQTGIAEFLKAGASTSFILREGDVMTVQGSSLPIGIIKEVDMCMQRMQLMAGDIVIMVTDGILDTPQDALGKEETFKHFIREVQASDPQYIADYLMQKSKALLGISEYDDMTIVVARVW